MMVVSKRSIMPGPGREWVQRMSPWGHLARRPMGIEKTKSVTASRTLFASAGSGNS